MIKRGITILSICITPLLAQQKNSVSLWDCYNAARENLPAFQDQQKFIETEQLKKELNKNLWLPQLSANAQATYQSDAISITSLVPVQGPEGLSFTTRSFGSDKDQYKATFDVNQMIYDGGVTKIQNKIAEASLKADLSQTVADIEKVKEQVNQFYFLILIMQENKRVLQTTLANLEERERSISSGLKNGVLTINDLRTIQSEILRTRQQISDIDHNIGAGYQILQIITNLKVSTNTQLVKPDTMITSTDSIQRAELLVLESQRAVLEGTRQLIGTQKLPKIYAFGQLGYGKPGLQMLSNEFNEFYMIGASLKWTLWDWGKTNKDQRMIAIQKEIVTSKEDQFRRSIKIAAENKKTQIVQLENTLKNDSLLVEIQSEIVKTNNVRFDQGIITSSEYVLSVNAETLARIQKETHQIQLLQSRIEYLSLLGAL